MTGILRVLAGAGLALVTLSAGTAAAQDVAGRCIDGVRWQAEQSRAGLFRCDTDPPQAVTIVTADAPDTWRRRGPFDDPVFEVLCTEDGFDMVLGLPSPDLADGQPRTATIVVGSGAWALPSIGERVDGIDGARARISIREGHPVVGPLRAGREARLIVGGLRYEFHLSGSSAALRYLARTC